MKCMVNNSIARLDQMHIFMGFEEKIDVELLRPFLQFLKSLSIFNCYMTEEIQFALQQNIEKYNCLLIRSIWAKKDSDEELKQLEHVLEVVRHNHQKLDETFVNVFGNMTYSQHVYINLNVLLYKTCHKLIERHVRISYMNNDQDKLKKMLRIYFTLKQLIENTLRNIENVQHRPRLEMENFCDWFGVEILKAWFNQVAREAKILIRNNIEKNYVNILSQPVISGLPTKHLNNIIFNKVIRFWKELDWPDVKAIEIMINCLNDCILEYYERMLRKIKKEHIPPYKRKINVSNEAKLQAYELIQNIINSKPGKMKQNAFCTFEKFIDDFVKLLIHNLTKMGVKFVIYEIWNEILKNLHESLDEHKSKGVADVREILSMIVAKLSDKEDILTHNQMKNFKYNRLKSDFLELDYTKMN
ncbi:protein unc-13 homolog 4B-like isoform X4 [Centruroides vittatus]|uniref:protein unc-13 homolog 4B-like isoform X4 n=1 Tax=Centruroides vittatus TaxID=120091 RepID=UPI003510AD88